MDKTENKKYRSIVLIIFLVLVIFGVLITNNIKTKGHSITSTSLYDNIPILYVSGFEYEKFNHFFADSFEINDEEEHYFVIERDEKAKECLLVFGAPIVKDEYVTVEFSDEEGNTLESQRYPIDKTGNCALIDNITENAKIMYIELNNSFNLRRIVFCNPYSNNSRKITFAIIYFIIISIIGLVLFITKPLCNTVVKIYDHVVNYKVPSVKKLIFYILGSFGLSLIIIKLISMINQNITDFNFKSILFCFLILLGFSHIVFNRKMLKSNIALYSAIIIFLVGGMYALLEPVSDGVCWDDETHATMSFRITNMVDKRESFADIELVYGFLDTIYNKTIYNRQYSKYSNNQVDYIFEQNFFYERNEGLASLELKHVVYFPFVIGEIISQGLGLPHHICYIIGKLFNLLFFTLICYWAMKVFPGSKICILFFMMIPTVSIMAGGYSYDPWLIGLLLLGYALFYQCRNKTENTIQVSDYILIPFIFSLGIIAKPVYFIMIVPAFLISSNRFKDKKTCMIYRIAILCSIILPFIYLIINNILNPGVGDTRGGDDVNSTEQIKFIINNIPFAIKVFVRFLSGYLNPFMEGHNYLNNLGYSGEVSGWLLTLIFILLGIAINSDGSLIKFYIKERVLWLFVYICIGGLCALSMYIVYTGVGSSTVAGCQGRYLLPILFWVLYILLNNSIISKKTIKYNNGINTFLTICLFLVNVYCIWKGCVTLY